MEEANFINLMKEDLLGRSTVKRRKAAVFLRTKLVDEDYCESLIQALKKEESSANWQTKVEIVKTLGSRKCVRVKSYLKELIETQGSYSFLAMALATSYVRLERKGLDDVGAITELINTGKYSITEGALEALGYDQMLPSIKEQKNILDKCRDFGNNRPKGYTDPRYGLVAACAKWDSELVEGFLNECVMSGDVPLKYVAEKSLQRKYVKLR